MGLDNRGVERGGCSVSGCQCGEFVSFPTRQVCRTCLHPPVKHTSKAPPAVLPPYPSGVQGRSFRVTHPGLMSYTNRFILTLSFFVCPSGWRGRGYLTGDVSHFAQSPPRTRAQHIYHHEQAADLCPQCRQPCAVLVSGLHCERCTAGSRPCERKGCSNPRFYDPVLGEFKYCSPQCRNKHYLPWYTRKLKESLEQSKGRCAVEGSSRSTSSPTLRRSSSHGSIASLSFSHPHAPQTQYMYSPQTHRR